MSAAHTVSLSLPVEAVFQELMMWIGQTQESTTLPPSLRINVVAIKLVTVSRTLNLGAGFGYGVLTGAHDNTTLSGTMTLLIDNLQWVNESWQGKPFGASAAVTAAPLALSVSADIRHPALLLSMNGWQASFTSAQGTVNAAVISGTSCFDEQVELTFLRDYMITGGIVGG